MLEWFKNIADENVIQDNLTFASLFIAMYENMVDYVVSNLKGFLCDVEVRDGKEIWKSTNIYRDEIKKRIVDQFGNTDVTKASFLWLVDNNAITESDYKCFLESKRIRNKYAHELVNVMMQGVTENEIKQLFDMFALYQKITKWYFCEIEAPILGEELPDSVDSTEVSSFATIVFSMVLEVLYRGKSKEYKEMLEKFEKDYRQQ